MMKMSDAIDEKVELDQLYGCAQMRQELEYTLNRVVYSDDEGVDLDVWL